MLHALKSGSCAHNPILWRISIFSSENTFDFPIYWQPPPFLRAYFVNFFFNPTVTFLGGLDVPTSVLWGYRATEARSPSWKNSVWGAITVNVVLIKCGERFERSIHRSNLQNQKKYLSARNRFSFRSMNPLKCNNHLLP